MTVRPLPSILATIALGGASVAAAAPTKLAVPASSVTASANDGHVPANTVDGNLGTRWSAEGNGQWIRYDLGATRLVAFVKIAWYQGNARHAFFDLQTSADGITFTSRFSGQSSGTTTALETYDFSDVSARYVRIVGQGNSVNAWNSITETEVWIETATDTQAPSVPTNLTATAVSSSEIDLQWTASTDNVGVAGYNVYRGGALVASPAGTSFADTGLAASTTFSYTVKARDAAGNLSAASGAASATTTGGGGSCTGALSSLAAIQDALKNAGPGAVISIAPGTYTGARSSSGDPGGQGLFFGGANGTSSSHIVLKGCNPSSRPILQGSGTGDGSYGIHLTGDFWEIRDVEVRTAQKGIMLDNASHVLISNVTVSNIGDEGVHFRDGSSFNTLENSRILNTGRFQPGFGEGAYVGSDNSSSFNHTVVGNVIRNVRFDGGITAEHVDVKEGADGTLIEGCFFDGTGISGENSADSFVDVKGVNTTIRNNQGARSGNANVLDAFQVRTHGTCCATGTNNHFDHNTVNLDDSAGFVVMATSATSGTTASGDVRVGGGNLYNANVNK